MKNQILTLWQQGQTAEQICDHIGCARNTVFWHLKYARMSGDPRAARRKYRSPAQKKAVKITLLNACSASTAYIASVVGVSQRMVQIRLKELS